MSAKYKIKSILGYGCEGIVFLIEYNDNNYAKKISFAKNNNINDLKKSLDNEIEFQSEIVSKYPSYFMKLHFSDIFNKYRVDNEIINFVENNKIFMNDTRKCVKKIYDIINGKMSSACITKIYDLVDGNLEEVFLNLTKEEIYSSIIQIAYSIHILEKYNYIHGDTRSNENIAYTKTYNEFLKIYKYQVPTFGHNWKLIDYDRITKKDKSDVPYMYGNEFLYAFANAYLLKSLDFKLKDFFKRETSQNMYVYGINKIAKEKEIKNNIIRDTINKLQNLNIDTNLVNWLFVYLYPNRYTKMILSENYSNLYKKYKNEYKNIKVTYSFPKIKFKQIKKIVENKNNIKKLIKFFMKKIH
jgi:hypothetical protein